MKKVIFVLMAMAMCIASYAQDTLKYNYAILNIDRPHYLADLEYNNGFKEDLWKKLHISMKDSRHDMIFRCFEYLNDNGYEYTGGEFFTGGLSPEGTTEYIFKRRRK